MQNGEWTHWPALLGLAERPRWRLKYRLVRNGAGAADDGADGHDARPGLAAALRDIGACAAGTLSWRPLPDGDYLASVSAAGAKGAMVAAAAWSPDPGIPPALAALGVLGELVKRLEQAGSPPGREASGFMSRSAIARQIASGRAVLCKRLGIDRLSAAFAALLMGDPLTLETAGSISPAALAALMLPLERDWADRAALLVLGETTGVDAAAPETTAARWDLMLVPREAPGDAPASDSALHERAAALARVLCEGQPQGPDLDSRPAPRQAIPPAPQRTDVDHAIHVWGATSSGKTAYMAQLYLALRRDSALPWQIELPPGTDKQWFEDRIQEITESNRFPAATSRETRGLIYTLVDRHSDRKVTLAFEDWPGAAFEYLRPEIAQMLARADGLILLLDPTRGGARQDAEVKRAFLAIREARAQRGQDPRPLAVCLSKCDEHIRTPAQLAHVREHPLTLLGKDGETIAHDVRANWKDPRFFALSAAGLHIRYGMVEPCAFYDEDLCLRLNPEGETINLLEPVLWVIARLGA